MAQIDNKTEISKLRRNRRRQNLIEVFEWNAVIGDTCDGQLISTVKAAMNGLYP